VHVFELLLRLKANYLWPAMWNNAFAVDDPLNAKLADEYGIVMGTSHEEPMMCAEKEWKDHGQGPWNYATNKANIDAFWRGCMQRDRNFEQIVTMGMRGENDTPMANAGNIAQMEEIVHDQRDILRETVNPDLNKVPQVWALYKEVQTYYEHGMRVPDDVTLLWSDDNWGDLRRLPTAEERKRSGGAGVYYHFDYVGGPRSYKWLNTVPITKIWEQMHLALAYGADRIWVVNVGDLKPMEFPIEFFLSYARTPRRWDEDKLHAFAVEWATREFGPEHAEEIATAVEQYTRYNGRRKPEMIDPGTFSLTSYGEAARVDAEWSALAARVDALAGELPENERASYFELVQYPVDACANLTEMYIAAARNAQYAVQGRAETNAEADKVRGMFAKDAALTDEYNHKLMGGKWDHMMDQTHIGYTYWNEPVVNAMPAVSEVQPLGFGQLHAVGEDGDARKPALGDFDSVAQQTRVLTLFNAGSQAATFKASASAPWIVVMPVEGSVSTHQDVSVHVDWASAPAGVAKGSVTITQRYGGPIVVPVEARRVDGVTRENAQGFVESDGVVAMEAADTTARSAGAAMHWVELPGYGETRSAMTVFPVDAASEMNSQAGLSYRFYFADEGKAQLEAVLAPTMNFVPGRGLRFAVSLDDGPRVLVDALADASQAAWEKAVSDGVRKVTVPLTIPASGWHTLHVWAVDPAVVLERLVVSKGMLKPSYLGPPESFAKLK
jgi:hypothetical protein